RLFAADERSGADPDFYVKVEIRFEDPGPEKTVVLCLPDRRLQTSNGQRVFGPNIDEALVRSDGAPGDCHSLKHSVWIALENAPVHKCSRIALVPVADDIFVCARGLRNRCPFQTGRVTSPSSSAQAAPGDRLDHLSRLHLKQNAMESRVTARLDVF